MTPWEQIEADPEYQAEPQDVKEEFKRRYFIRNIALDPEYRADANAPQGSPEHKAARKVMESFLGKVPMPTTTEEQAGKVALVKLEMSRRNMERDWEAEYAELKRIAPYVPEAIAMEQSGNPYKLGKLGGNPLVGIFQLVTKGVSAGYLAPKEPEQRVSEFQFQAEHPIQAQAIEMTAAAFPVSRAAKVGAAVTRKIPLIGKGPGLVSKAEGLGVEGAIGGTTYEGLADYFEKGGFDKESPERIAKSAVFWAGLSILGVTPAVFKEMSGSARGRRLLAQIMAKGKSKEAVDVADKWVDDVGQSIDLGPPEARVARKAPFDVERPLEFESPPGPSDMPFTPAREMPVPREEAEAARAMIPVAGTSDFTGGVEGAMQTIEKIVAPTAVRAPIKVRQPAEELKRRFEASTGRRWKAAEDSQKQAFIDAEKRREILAKRKPYLAKPVGAPAGRPPKPIIRERLGSEAQIEARKNPGGYYQLFYRGTRNEVFAGEKFKSPQEARQYFKVAKVKETGEVKPTGPEAGVELYSGFDPRLIMRGKGKLAESSEAKFNAADIALKAARSSTRQERIDAFKRATYDIAAPVKERLRKVAGVSGEEAAAARDKIAGATPRAQMYYDAYVKATYKGISRAEEVALNRYRESLRTITIKGYRPDHLRPQTLDEANAFVVGVRQMPELRAKLDRAIETEQAFYLKELERARDEGPGLIGPAGEEGFAAMQKRIEDGIYSPSEFIEFIDPPVSYQVGGRTINITESGIPYRLKKGSESVLENDGRKLAQEYVMRMENRINRNKAQDSIFQIAEQQPQNGIVSRDPIWGKDSVKMGVKRKGNMYDFYMEPEAASTWITSDPLINETLAKVIGWSTGVIPLKMAATGYNAAFGAIQLVMDSAHLMMSSGAYSRHLPKAYAQLSVDYIQTMKDAWRHGPKYRAYIEADGGLNFLTSQGRLGGGNISNPALRQLDNFASYVPNATEAWTRLAHVNRLVKSGVPYNEAVYQARMRVDYSQYGAGVKAADVAIPYLNAAFQSMRAPLRYAREHPGAFTYKLSQYGTASMLLYLANRQNKEAYDSIPAEIKAGYWVITTPFYHKDKEGNRRHVYFTFRKDPIQRVVGSAFDGVTAAVVGDEVDPAQMKRALADLAPVDPTSGGLLPPAFKALVGYVGNVDLYRRRPVVPGKIGNVELPEEYIPGQTHPLAVAMRHLGLSPIRTEYAAKQVLTYSNPIGDVVGMGLREILDTMPPDERDRAMAEIMAQTPLLKRIVRETKPDLPYIKLANEVQVEVNTERWKKNRQLDFFAQQYWNKKDPELLKKTYSFLEKFDPDEQERLANRFNAQGALIGKPDRPFWMRLQDLPPEARARVYEEKYKSLSDKEKAAMNERAVSIPGIASDDFVVEFQRIRQMRNQR